MHYLSISENIQLKPLQLTDAKVIFNLVQRDRTNLQKYLLWVSEVTDLRSTKMYIADRINSGLNESQWFCIVYQNVACGVFAVKSITPDTGIAEIGYWLDSSVHAKGIISSIIKKLPTYLRDFSNTVTIEFRCLSQNFSSIKVAEKSGAKLVNSVPDFARVNNRLQNLNIYHLQI